MRDHGCYFLAGTAQEVKLFRESCGKIKIESIPKMMSRLGQCFTQGALTVKSTTEKYIAYFFSTSTRS